MNLDISLRHIERAVELAQKGANKTTDPEQRAEDREVARRLSKAVSRWKAGSGRGNL